MATPQLALPLVSSNGQTDRRSEPSPVGLVSEEPALADREPLAGRVVRSGSWQDSSITLVVAVVAAAASYGHMYDVALLAGEPLWIARAFPITVDGLVLAALRRGETGRRWLLLGVLVSIACNVLAQFPELVTAHAGPVVSAWPPLALYGTHRLLHGHREIDTRGSGRLEPSAPTRTNETP